ncbi:hypothetical protein HYALB_00011143 [Hymenoscyphus albidus]|uniref:Iron-sulfur cluster assembly factor IBA57 homolog, mitochondrial n=1 Tax=Hymenoscyphus albidus TaxID=595503 RepID=A0A9N9LNA2_9HELO|nr:hypothetical protein HYALB_00011143 [Hymenoscyphus albidus]
MKPPIPHLTRFLLSPSQPYICTTCRSTRLFRNPKSLRFSTTPPQLSTRPPPPPKAHARLPSRRLISLTGPDASKYLQGVITNTVTPPQGPWKEGFYAAFLNAKGRVLADVFVYRLAAGSGLRAGDSGEESEGEGWLIEVDAVEVERLKPVGELGEEVGEEVYRLRRYLHGVPEGQEELFRESALPQESNIDWMGGIDYKKGCYVGQELTVRTHHRGVVRKRILPVQFYGLDEPIPKTFEYDPTKRYSAENILYGTDIERFQPGLLETIVQGATDEHPTRKKKSTGKVITGVGNVGLALCRLKEMTPSGSGEVDYDSFQEGQEFMVEWGGDEKGVGKEFVKVRAFVPEWHLSQK